MPYQSDRFPGSICGLEQIVSCYVRTTVPGSDRTVPHRSYHHPPSPPRPRPFISGATRRPEIMPANNPRPVGRRPRCGICSLNLACRRSVVRTAAKQRGKHADTAKSSHRPDFQLQSGRRLDCTQPEAPPRPVS